MASPSGSSATSFHTAHGAMSPPINPQEISTGGIGQNGTAGTNSAAGQGASYRPVRRLPYELKDHIRVFLEERMYGEAIQLLSSLLAAGGSDGVTHSKISAPVGAEGHVAAAATDVATTRPPTETPVWIPPPSHLAVLATLIVHPAYTSRTQDGTDRRVAGHALQYLRHILTIAGPVQVNLAQAFAFKVAQGASIRGDSYRRRSNGRNSTSASASASASNTGSRSHSHLRRRRLRGPSGLSARTNGDSEYVDSGMISFDDEDDDMSSGGAVIMNTGDALARSTIHSAAGTDDEGNSGDYGGDDDIAVDSSYLGGADPADEDAVGARMATRDSVWVRGQDFWHVAGWALSCSVREPARWAAWRPWLAYLVDVLEADVGARFAAEAVRDRARDGDGDGGAELEDDDTASPMDESLLVRYLDGCGGGHTQLRRVAAAVLADGSQPALLREVFDKETVVTDPAARSEAAPGKTATTKARRVLDLANDKFGDYSDDDESAPSTPRSAGSPAPDGAGGGAGDKKGAKGARKASGGGGVSATSGEAEVSSGDSDGFHESLPLRLRLFYLIVLAALYVPEDFASADAVYRTFAEVLREADVSVYAAFLAAPPPPLPPVLADHGLPATADVFAGMLRYVLFPYMPAAAPKPHAVDPDAAEATSNSRLAGIAAAVVTPRILERCFLPFAANTVLLGANLRMALAVESLFRLLWVASTGSSDDEDNDDGRNYASSQRNDHDLAWTPSLQAAAEAGVRAREARVGPARASSKKTSNSKSHAVETLGRDLLRRSGKRLLTMVRLARLDAGLEPLIESDLVTSDLV